MRIGIYFGDNDFWRTITVFLEQLKNGANNHLCGKLSIEDRYTKERIVYLFNNLANSLYLVHQNGFCYNFPIDMNRLKEYLIITKRNVYINDEVNEKLKEDNNGEFHYIDIDEK